MGMNWEHIFIRMNLKKLLETIQEKLAGNIDSYYNVAKELIGTEKQHNLGFLKEDLKKQIETYLKLIVKNIIYYEEHNFAWSKYLKEAIKNGK